MVQKQRWTGQRVSKPANAVHNQPTWDRYLRALNVVHHVETTYGQQRCGQLAQRGLWTGQT